MNRLSIRYSIPPRYAQSDFQDIIDRLINKTKLRVDNGYIKFGMSHKSQEFVRFGRKFKITLLAFCGQIHITITESTGIKRYLFF